jgi:hypothetical protein
MSALALRFVEHVHGHLGWLATLALWHPAILLRRPRRRALLAASAATGLATCTGLLGATLYPSYRELVKPVIFAASPTLGNAFERKEHLAVAVVVLSWVGLVTHWAECRNRGSSLPIGRIAFVAYVGAALLAAVTASLGLAVATHHSF